MSKYLNFVIILLFAFSCGEEQFGGVRKVDPVQTTNQVVNNSVSSCSAFTYIKPKVDFLFLWDNSTSSIFIGESIKTALNNTVNLISSKFDYHIMLAPLNISPTGSVNDQAKLVVDNPTGLSGSAPGMLIPKDQASNSLNFGYVPGSKEEGAKRAADLISANITNGIFRPGSNLNVVIMSNEDDNSWQGTTITDADRVIYTQDKVHKLLCLRGFYSPPSGKTCSGANLNLSMMRFHSIVAMKNPGTSCTNLTTWKRNLVYKEISSRIYSQGYTNGFYHFDQATRTDLHVDPFLGIVNYDSYDICNVSDFSSVFDGINSTIQDSLIPHEYNYWPLASSGANAIDPNEIKVFKDGVQFAKLPNPPPANSTGFTFINSVQTQNTRYAPTSGEPFTGYMIQLHGGAIVKHPECMTVTTQTPKDFYGYVTIQSKPVESTIVLKINGQVVPKSTTNGWQLIKTAGQPQFFNSKNIKIAAPASICPTVSNPQEYCGGSPPDNKSGYFLQVFGTAIYSNGANVEVDYFPAAN